MRKEILKNSFDKDINFDNLKEAKEYYLIPEEQLKELGNGEDEVERNKEIESAENLEELADILNKYSDICDNGSQWNVEVHEEKYEIMKRSIEVAYKDRKSIAQGITSEDEWADSELVESFDTLEEAREKLKDYKTSIKELSGSAGKYYLVEEYYIEYNEYEDGEVTNAGDIYDYSNMIIEVVEKSKYNILGTYNNFESAEKAMEEFDGENGAYMSF